MTDMIRIANVTDVPEGDVIAVNVQGKSLALYRVGNEYFVSNNLCNHGQAYLSDGFLDGDIIECPLHGGCFNVRNGAPCHPPVTKPMETYEVIVEGDAIYIAGL